MSEAPAFVRSRENPLLARVARLARDARAYRRLGQVWLEGEHLCTACVARGPPVAQAVLSERGWSEPRLRALAEGAARTAVLADALFDGLVSTLESPAAIGFLIDAPPVHDATLPGVASVVLDRLQDPGNCGSVLRSAAAFGFGQVIALDGTAALWSPKVLRAGMGAHFALRLIEGADLHSLDALAVPLLATSPHAGLALDDEGAALPDPCAWVLGHEGQGLAAAVAARCAMMLGIGQPGGEESLNVAAAGAVCLYESARQRGGKDE